MDSLQKLRAAWEELKNELVRGRFDPKTEADVQCFLYSCLRKKLGTARNIHAEFNHDKRRRTDLVIDNVVFIEINFILKSGRRTPAAWQPRKKNANEEIARLAEVKKTRPEILPVLAILAEDYKEEDETWFYDDIRKSCKDQGITLLTAYVRALKSSEKGLEWTSPN